MIYNHCNIVYDVELHKEFIYATIFGLRSLVFKLFKARQGLAISQSGGMRGILLWTTQIQNEGAQDTAVF